jgi:hypothetical protein
MNTRLANGEGVETGAEKRLGIRQVCQILEGEASLPDVHMATVHPEDQIIEGRSNGSGSGRFNSISLTFPR